MPLFIVVSGAVYGICKKKGKYASWKELLTNKTKRILYTYVSFGLLVLAPCMVYIELTNNYITYCISEVLKGGNNIRHLWYLLSLFEMFIIAHVFHNILEKQKWITALSIFITIGLVYKYTIHFDYFQLKMTVTYMPYFILGYYIGNESLKIRLSNLRATNIILIAVIICFFKYRLPLFTIPVSDYAVAFFFIIAIFHVTQHLKIGTEGKYYNILKRDGMGIYLWHVIFIYISYYHDLFVSVGMYGQIFSITVLSLILSIVLTYITRYLHLTYLIGESK